MSDLPQMLTGSVKIRDDIIVSTFLSSLKTRALTWSNKYVPITMDFKANKSHFLSKPCYFKNQSI